MGAKANPYDRYLSLPGDILASKSVATLAPMSALQNLAIDATGAIVMTSLLDGRIWRVPFGGDPQLLTQIDGRPSGISPAPGGGWMVFGWTTAGGVAAFEVQPDGRWEIFAEAPDAVFPNGAVRLPGDRYLFADSITATIWVVDHSSRSIKAWYSHPSLGPNEGEWAPALNGLQMSGDRLYMSNSSKLTLLALDVRDGEPAGEPEVIMSECDFDDFAFDQQGNIFAGTHPYDVILKLTPQGELSRAAGPDEGVRGCTACAFGRRPGDETGLYVVADGGLFNPLSGGLKPAQLVRLEVGVPGALAGAARWFGEA